MPKQYLAAGLLAAVAFLAWKQRAKLAALVKPAPKTGPNYTAMSDAPRGVIPATTPYYDISKESWY